MKITLDIPIEKFRFSLVGDGYTLEEAKNLTEEHLNNILQTRIIDNIHKEYYRGKRIGLFNEEDLS